MKTLQEGQVKFPTNEWVLEMNLALKRKGIYLLECMDMWFENADTEGEVDMIFRFKVSGGGEKN